MAEMDVPTGEALITFEHNLGGDVDITAWGAAGERVGYEFFTEIDENIAEVMLVPGVAVRLTAELADEAFPEERPGVWREADEDEKFLALMDNAAARGSVAPPGVIH